MMDGSDPAEEWQARLAARGEITSDEYRPAYTCNRCREPIYTRKEPTRCPHCRSDDIDAANGLPGALLLNPGVEWPDDDSFVGGGD
jgi:transposase